MSCMLFKTATDVLRGIFKTQDLDTVLSLLGPIYDKNSPALLQHDLLILWVTIRTTEKSGIKKAK